MSSDDEENEKMQSICNRLVNGNLKKNEYRRLYEPERAYSFTNKKMEKSEKNEDVLYGYYETGITEEKQRLEMILNIKNKGLKKLEHEIMVSPLRSEYGFPDIIICRFIEGKSIVIKSNKKLNEKEKEKYKKDYDTIIRIDDNEKNPIKRYNILKEENIDILYYIRLKPKINDFEFNYD